MIKKLSVRWLRGHDACGEAQRDFKAQRATNPLRVIDKLLVKRDRCRQYVDWACWLVLRLMTLRQRAAYMEYVKRRAGVLPEVRLHHIKREISALRDYSNLEDMLDTIISVVVELGTQTDNWMYGRTMRQVVRHGVKILQEG